MTARKRFTIEVTQGDIDRGIREDSSHCVVARAVARTIPNATRIEVDTQTIRFTADEKRLCYLTPWAAQSYVIAFDAGDVIKPFEFTIRNPIELQRKRSRTVQREVKPLSMTQNAVYLRKKKAAEKAAGPSISEPSLSRSKVPKVFKKQQRSYGHRLLRINQEGVQA